MKPLTTVVIVTITFVVATLAFMLAGAFTLRSIFGVERYRELRLPIVVIGGSVVGGASLGIDLYRRMRRRT